LVQQLQGWSLGMRHSTEAPDGARARLAATVAALRRPSSYPGKVWQVEAIETHMSWVFLTQTHAYKLKKPIRTPVLDHTTIEARRRACETELELNRRLAPKVYLEVVPLVSSARGVRLEQEGEPIDWLVKMVRLPREDMLDARIERGVIRTAEIDGLAAVLANFYATAERAALDPSSYRYRITADIESKSTSLEQRRYGLSTADIHAVVADQARWLVHHGGLLDARAAKVVDAHGDLRPEHICLELPKPVVIDCLEFDRDLRLLDPLSELAFLALECRRLEAEWIGEQLLATYADRSGDHPPPGLVPFYQSHHALVRAAIAVWHLDDDSLGESDRWRTRGAWYLHTARRLLRG
jgi:aminoglycoside phosphotransferase family enzyme